MAGGVAAAALADGEAGADAVREMVTVGAGLGLLFPHADSAAAAVIAPSSKVAADLNVAAGIWSLHKGESCGTGVRGRNHPVTNRNSGDDRDSAGLRAAIGVRDRDNQPSGGC
jgi:hypothetical protein